VNFQDNLKCGKRGEKIVCNFLDSKNIPFTLNTSSKLKNLAKWDIGFIINGQVIKVEVKFDLMASKTGNMAIEFFNTKMCKPSGIDATDSALWVVVLESKGYVCSVGKLKDFIKRNKPLKTIISGGDKNASLYIYKLEHILPIFRLLDENICESFLVEEANWKPVI
jgi:hypothetical protein